MTPVSQDSSKKTNRKMVQLRYVLMPLVIILVAVFLFGIVKFMAPKPAKKPVVIKAPLVEVMAIERENITFKVLSQGSVFPRTETSLISEVSGMVVAVSNKFKVGGYFKKGEQLLAIDDITYQVALIQAQSRLDSAQANVIEENARTQQAEEEWYLTGKPLSEAPVLAIRKPQQKKAQAELLSAKANVKAAQIKLQRTKIVAPYDALIKSKMVDIGQYVSTGTKLAVSFAVDYAEIRLPIKPQDVAFLNLPRINKKSELVSSVDISYQIAGVDHLWNSRLTRYEGVVDQRSRVHYVIAQIDDPYALKTSSNHDELHIGTFVNAVISGKELNDVVVIPRGAIYGANSLYLVDKENKLQITTINILRTDVKNVYTFDEFHSDNRIVVTKLLSPLQGMKLRIKGENQNQKNKMAEKKTKVKTHESA
jgi:RND family efflux transporter MFP subunit